MKMIRKDLVQSLGDKECFISNWPFNSFFFFGSETLLISSSVKVKQEET